MQISLIIPTFNRARFLQRALKSVFDGTLVPDEIIVIDDGSSDETHNICQNFDIRYIYQDNKGVSSARNLGIQSARFEWIAFLDSDDEWHKNKLRHQANFHKQHPHILCSQTQEIWKVDGKHKNQPKRYTKKEGFIFQYLLDVCNVTTSSFMTHKSALEDVGVFDEDLKVCEDQDLYLRIAKKYPFGLLKEVLITKHAGTSNQLSFTTPLMDLYRLKALLKHPEAFDVARKKYDVLFQGALKHNNTKLLQKLNTLKKIARGMMVEFD